MRSVNAVVHVRRIRLRTTEYRLIAEIFKPAFIRRLLVRERGTVSGTCRTRTTSAATCPRDNRRCSGSFDSEAEKRSEENAMHATLECRMRESSHHPWHWMEKHARSRTGNCTRRDAEKSTTRPLPLSREASFFFFDQSTPPPTDRIIITKKRQESCLHFGCETSTAKIQQE